MEHGWNTDFRAGVADREPHGQTRGRRLATIFGMGKSAQERQFLLNLADWTQ